jgi:hypothetical protein
MRRKEGSLVPLEVSALQAALLVTWGAIGVSLIRGVPKAEAPSA